MTLRDDLTGGTSRTGHASQHNQLTDAVNAKAPLADTDGFATVTVTPDPVSGAHSMMVIEVAADQAIMAWKIAGDAHPRVIITASGVFFLGDGTYDPSASGAAVSLFSGGMTLSGTSNSITVDKAGGTHRANLLDLSQLALLLGNGAGTGGSAVYSGSGAPTVGGEVGDFYFRKDTPSTSNQRLYACTVAGASGAATWVGIL